ncbi:hypothetical protein ACR9GP_22800 [Enterobacter ludwigii]
MVNPLKKYKGQIISPEQGAHYPAFELGKEQNVRLLRSYIDSTTMPISIMLGQFLRSIGCTHVELFELEFRDLFPTEKEQWVWNTGLAPLNGRDSKMFQFGMPRATATAMTETTLGLKPSTLSHTIHGQQPSETELRFLTQLGQVLVAAITANTPALQELTWQLQQSDAPQEKGYYLRLQLMFPEHSWPLTLYWYNAFAELQEQCCDQAKIEYPVTQPQLEMSLMKIPVQLKATLFSTKLTIAELEKLLQGEPLPVSLPEQSTLGNGNFVMGVGRLYDRNGHLVFHLNDAS